MTLIKPSNGGDASSHVDEKYVHSDLTAAIIRVFYQVYNELGHGFLESVYQAAMEIALRSAGFTVVPKKKIPVWFRGQQIGDFEADIVVNDLVILELKAARALEAAHEAQLLNYLRATEIEVGLLLNFGQRPTVRRMLFTKDRKVVVSSMAAGKSSLIVFNLSKKISVICVHQWLKGFIPSSSTRTHPSPSFSLISLRPRTFPAALTA